MRIPDRGRDSGGITTGRCEKENRGRVRTMWIKRFGEGPAGRASEPPEGPEKSTVRLESGSVGQ